MPNEEVRSMKKCPYCAEEIRDEAIKCRYCHSWLVSEVPAGAETPPAGIVTSEPTTTPEAEVPSAEVAAAVVAEEAIPSTTETMTPAASDTGATTSEAAGAASAPEAKIEFTHSGDRYLLGYTDEFFGIWDRQSPAEPTERFPRTDDGWRDVWQRYAAIERNWMDLRTGQRSQ